MPNQSPRTFCSPWPSHHLVKKQNPKPEYSPKPISSLGSLQSADDHCKPDMMRCIGLASSVMFTLKNMRRNHYLTSNTKIRVYKTLILPVLLYASKILSLFLADAKALEAFHIKRLCHITHIHWQDYVHNKNILAHVRLPHQCFL